MTILYDFSSLLCAAGCHCNFVIGNYIIGNLRIMVGRTTAIKSAGKCILKQCAA